MFNRIDHLYSKSKQMNRYSLVMTRQTYKERALTPEGRKKKPEQIYRNNYQLNSLKKLNEYFYLFI